MCMFRDTDPPCPGQSWFPSFKCMLHACPWGSDCLRKTPLSLRSWLPPRRALYFQGACWGPLEEPSQGTLFSSSKPFEDLFFVKTPVASRGSDSFHELQYLQGADSLLQVAYDFKVPIISKVPCYSSLRHLRPRGLNFLVETRHEVLTPSSWPLLFPRSWFLPRENSCGLGSFLKMPIAPRGPVFLLKADVGTTNLISPFVKSTFKWHSDLALPEKMQLTPLEGLVPQSWHFHDVLTILAWRVWTTGYVAWLGTIHGFSRSKLYQLSPSVRVLGY